MNSVIPISSVTPFCEDNRMYRLIYLGCFMAFAVAAAAIAPLLIIMPLVLLGLLAMLA